MRAGEGILGTGRAGGSIQGAERVGECTLGTGRAEGGEDILGTEKALTFVQFTTLFRELIPLVM